MLGSSTSPARNRLEGRIEDLLQVLGPVSGVEILLLVGEQDIAEVRDRPILVGIEIRVASTGWSPWCRSAYTKEPRGRRRWSNSRTCPRSPRFRTRGCRRPGPPRRSASPIARSGRRPSRVSRFPRSSGAESRWWMEFSARTPPPSLASFIQDFRGPDMMRWVLAAWMSPSLPLVDQPLRRPGFRGVTQSAGRPSA